MAAQVRGSNRQREEDIISKLFFLGTDLRHLLDQMQILKLTRVIRLH